MLLEKELEDIADWFHSEYPDGKFSGHAGYNKKNSVEEYHICFELNGKNWNVSPLHLPPQIYNAPKEEITQFKKDYVSVQKKKIAAAALGMVFS